MKKRMRVLLAAAMTVTMSVGNLAVAGAEEAVDYEIAVSLPFTGDYHTYAEYLQKGMDLAVEHLEEDGGFNGNGGTLKITYYDDANNPEEGVALAEEIVENENYLVSVGSFSSSVTLPCATVYNEGEMVQLAPTCSHQDFLSMTEWGFSLAMSQDTCAALQAAWNTNYCGAKNIAVIYANDELGVATESVYVETAEKLGATIVAAEDFVSGNTNDFSPIITKIMQEEVDMVFTVCSEDELVYMVKQADQLGFHPTWSTCTKAATENVINNLGELAEGIYSYYGVTGDMSNEVYARYYESYMAENPGEEMTSQWADYGYNAIRMIIWTIENGGTDRSSFRDVLATMKDFQGVDGTLSYGEGHVVSRQQNLICVENGAWTTIDPGFDAAEVAGL